MNKLLLSLALVLQLHAQDALPFQALKWRSIGPNRGGRSISSAGTAARPLEYYFGAVGGGLWKTTDGGNSWKPVTDGQLASSSVGAVAISESNPDVVYIGMGETELRGNIMQGDGVYKSIDAGKTWKHVGLKDTQAISRVRVHPANPDIAYVAALGHPYGPNTERGVFRTTDGGKTWKKILYKSDKSGAVDLCLDPNDPKTLYAAIWDVYRTPWLLNDGGPESGLYKSTDGGDTWTDITRATGLPVGIIGKIGIAVSGGNSKRLYAMVEADNGGLFRSEDAGKTWTLISDDRKIRQRAFYYSRVYADPKDAETVYVMNTAFFKSTDGGKTFKTIRVPHGDNHDLWIAANDPKRMVNSNDGGANVSFNGGETWSSQPFPTAQLYHVTTTKDFPYHVCGAQQDNTTVCVPSDSGANHRDPRAPAGSWMYQVGGGESGYIAPDPVNPDVFYAGSQGALLTKYNRATGKTWDIQVYPLFFSGMPAKDLKERWQWTYPIVFSPQNPKVLYTSSQHLWKTDNDGKSWQRISPDLTRADPATLGDSGGPITKDQNGPEIYGTIFTVAPSLQDANTIWTGSDDGLAYITRDGGKNWTNITPQGLPKFARISMIDASPHKPGTAYLAAKNYQLDDRAPYLYRTDDFGKTWTKIVNGIPKEDYTHVLREDTTRPGLLYAGTEHGIYTSFDNGGTWTSLLLNLPDTQVPDLVVEKNDLVIATHGRSFYVLDDINALRQYTPAAASEDAHLFQPKTAVRGMGPAFIDYLLKKPSDKVTIEIFDSKNQLVRSFTGTPDDDKPKKGADSGGGDEDSEFGPPRQKPPSRTAGLNRFTWNLQYPGATVFEGMILWGARAETGPMAVPGTYTVKFTANGVTQSAPLKVEKDPRLTEVTQAQLEEQFRFAMQIRDKLSEADEMVIKIRGMKKDKKLPSNVLDTLSTIEAEIYQVKNRSGQDPLNFPIKLNNQIAALGRVVMTGDGEPTAQTYEVYKELMVRLAALQARLAAALQ